MPTIINPILKGFNPDPSIIRVEDDYYIATSTFEWYPGVQIHHSKDLVNWRLLTRPLRRDSQLNMLGEMSSSGVWAPCLSYCNGTFYLVYTDVKENGTNHNYLVTTKDIEGDWSDRIYLHSRGFDPSMFHDSDGKKWVLITQTDPIAWNMITSFKTGMFRKIKNGYKLVKQYKKRDMGSPMFRGVSIQAYDENEKKMIGPVYPIFEGTKLGKTEGAHLYKRGEYYYLLTAEGGTGYAHAVTLARSKQLIGPYEVHPENPILSSYKKDCKLQRAGHADLVDTKEGYTYMVHLCSRPLNKKGLGRGRSVLGRETAIQKMKWHEDGWLRLEQGGTIPLDTVKSPHDVITTMRFIPVRDYFNKKELGIQYQWLRGDYLDEIMSLTEREGYLRLKGNEMVLSNFKQALIARRQQDFSYRAQTLMTFDPVERNQMAGLIVMYNVDLFYYLYVNEDSHGKKIIAIMKNDKQNIDIFAGGEIKIKENTPIHLRVMVDYEKLKFSFSYDEIDWIQVGSELDMTKLCDERVINGGGFTGNFVGICCHDPITKSVYADFDYFDYEGYDNNTNGENLNEKN